MKKPKKSLIIFLVGVLGLSIALISYYACFRLGVFDNNNHDNGDSTNDLDQYSFSDEEQARIIKNNEYLDIETMLYCLIKNVDIPADVQVIKNNETYPSEVEIIFQREKEYHWFYSLG